MFARSSVRSSVTSFTRDWLISFFWFLAQRCKSAIPKKWRSPIFKKKKKIPAENAGKTGFWAFSRDFLIRKNGISWISRAALYIFSWNFAHWCKMVMSRIWPSPIFEKSYFPCRKCRKYAEKTGFLAFSRDFISCFFWFFAQRCVLAKPKTWPSPIFKNFFSGRKCRK